MQKNITGNEVFSFVEDKAKVWFSWLYYKKMSKNNTPYKEIQRDKWIIINSDIDQKMG